MNTPKQVLFIDADKEGYIDYLNKLLPLVRPGGLVLVVDFSPHDLVELKREHAHVHLGFADNQVQGWLKSAGLHPLEPIHFPGRRLMTGIWRGEREAAHRAHRLAWHRRRCHRSITVILAARDARSASVRK